MKGKVKLFGNRFVSSQPDKDMLHNSEILGTGRKILNVPWLDGYNIWLPTIGGGNDER